VQRHAVSASVSPVSMAGQRQRGSGSGMPRNPRLCRPRNTKTKGRLAPPLRFTTLTGRNLAVPAGAG
jgi:hypothetical protein